jgi:MFS family permease
MRAFQGVAGALLVPSSLALIISTFPPTSQGRAIGTWTAWTGIAFIIGPLLGGILIVAASWRLIFAINILPILVTLFLLRFIQQEHYTQKKAKIDMFGVLYCAIGLGGTVYALIEQSYYGWLSPRIYIPLLAGLFVFVIFLRHEQKTPYGMLPLKLFKVHNFAVGNIATTAIYGGLSVASFLITIFIQQVDGYSAIKAGLALLPITIIMFMLSPRFGALSSKYGSRLFMGLGPFIGAIGFLTMLQVGRPLHYWTQLFPGILLFGIGLSITVAPLTSAILGAIDSTQAGVGSAINNAVSRIAGLLSVAIIGVVIGSTISIPGFHRGIILVAILLLLGSVVSSIGIRNSIQNQNS